MFWQGALPRKFANFKMKSEECHYYDLFSWQHPPQMAMNRGTSTWTNFVKFFSFARAPNVLEKNPYLCILLQLTPFNKSKAYESKLQQVY
jgi:hypothetical protein